MTCHHDPRCPTAAARDRQAAKTLHAHPEQGWSLLCNGVIVFDDGGELPPVLGPSSTIGFPAAA